MPTELLAQTSPLTWEHIGFSGDFLWDHAAATAGVSPAAQSQTRMTGSLMPKACSLTFGLSVVELITNALSSNNNHASRAVKRRGKSRFPVEPQGFPPVAPAMDNFNPGSAQIVIR
jgi:hypothetical protein